MFFSGLLTVVALIHHTGGIFKADFRGSIVGVQDAPVGRWPWMAHLNISNYDTKRWRCGGTLVSNEWVLTAANCLDLRRNPNLSRSMVWLGSHNLQGVSRFMGISYVIRHPDYRVQASGYVNDIALVKLKKKVTYSPTIAPVNLTSIYDIFGLASECWITGWGNIRNGVPLPGKETLQQLRIPIIPQSDCKAAYPDLTAAMLCAGSLDGGKDACDGDYGGPLVCRTACGFVQVGIISFGGSEGCGLPGFPGVYTRVAEYLGFISDILHPNLKASVEV